MPNCQVCKTSCEFTSYAGRSDEVCPNCGAMRRHRDNFVAMRRAGLFQLPVRSRILMVSIDPYLSKLRRRFSVTVLIKQPDIAGTIYGDICKPPFTEKSFEAVIATHVLEHVHNDAKAVAMIYQLLTPGGIFVSNVPCGTEPETNEFGRPDPKQHGHWRLYGRAGYKQLLQQTGFIEVTNAKGTAFIARRLT